MRPEKWRERTNPVPTHEHFRLWVAKEASDVSYVSICRQHEVRTNEIEKQLTSAKSHARDTIRENHLDANSHVLPGTEVITSPHRTIALRASEEGTRKYERSLGSLSSLNKAGVGDPRKEHSVDVMDVAVLPATIMDQVFRHGDLGSVKNGRLVMVRQLRSNQSDGKQQITHLIHIIPDVNIFRALHP